MFKKIVVFLSLFAFVEQLNVSVFAQTKKAGTKKRAAASSKRNASAARASSKRSLSARSLARASGATTTSSTSSTAENCIAKFTECMDAQIDTVVANYQYLADDPAVQAMQETTDPFRCVYYNSSKVEGLFANDARYCSSDLLANRKETIVDSKGLSKKKDSKSFNNMNVCSNQKDINELYLSYNYYCDLSTSEVGVSGMPVNKCNLKSSDGKSKNDIFATRDSYAYYNEANRRVSNGELKIINFEKTKLFKDKIEPLGLENWKQMSLSEGSVSDLLDDLGLTSNENEIFSINVVPPVGTGNFDASAQYDKARNICLGNSTFKLAGKKATANEEIIQSAISYLSSNCSGASTKNELERYYIAGTVVKPCEDGYTYNAVSNACVNPDDPLDTMEPHSADDYTDGNAELEQTDFLSAKKSCDLYEKTLISTRNKAYADFDTQLKNYIEDEVAKLIKNKSKSLTTIANALGSLQQTDAQITIDNIQRKTEILTSKTDAEIASMNAELNLATKKNEVAKTKINIQNETKSLISSNYERKILSACMSTASALISNSKNQKNLFELSVKASVEGDVKSEYNESGELNSDYATLDSTKYQEFYCNEVKDFNISQLVNEKANFKECSFALQNSGSLPMGIYKVILKGAGGGGGGKSATGGNNSGNGGNGGNGSKLETVLVLSKAESYTTEVGKGGSGGSRSILGKKAGSGGDGGATTMTIMGTTYTADGGKGGEGGGGGGGSRYRNGDNGMKGGNGEGGSGGGAGKYGDSGQNGSIEILCAGS